MTIENIQRTGLWKSSLAAQDSDEFELLRARLSAEFIKFRDNAEVLVGKIGAVLPGLTVHDVTHLDGLWETADLVAGENYPLNPLEAFIFGGAVLLHDSAMCYEAYVNGQTGVRSTTEWKDAYSIECDRSPELDDAERMETADFSALRTLHASQAENLVQMSWPHPDTNQPLYLIDDAELRTHCGRLIGRIASSHHWNIDALSARLIDQFNAPPPFPPEWTVDPIKVACLLRCADAAHINQARAPDFLYALIRRKGISHRHWQAQNRMTGPAIDGSNQSRRTIVYTSTLPFTENDAESWWIAYDAASLVDKEIKSSNALLKSRGHRDSAPEFKIERVEGAQSIEAMTQHIQVEGWRPCKAELHISNVEALVRELGGEKLYGAHSDKAEVVFRELLQNARDAVVARRFIDPNFEEYISVQLRTIGEDSWLYIEDSGIGMSHEVLTGSFLDFGSSFWKSSLIQTEFPGLRSSKFRSIGRFGIGFYSTFMIADEVVVVSKRWDAGLDDTNSLVFKNGVTLRPILKHCRVSEFGASASTQVRIRLKRGILEDESSINVTPGYMGVPAITPTLPEYVAAIVSGLDVKVSYNSSMFPDMSIHAGCPGTNPNSEMLLKQLSFSSHQSHNSGLDQYIKKNQHRIRAVEYEGRVFGMAAISTGPDTGSSMLGLRTTGGLATSVQGRHFSHYIGYLDHKPESAKRDTSTFEASIEVMKEWAIEQLTILKSEALTDYERCIVASNMCEFGIDPTPIARVLVAVDGISRFVTYSQLASIAETVPIAILKSPFMDHIDSHHSIKRVEKMALIRPLINGKYLSLEMDDEIPRNPNSLIGCLHRAVVAQGGNLTWSRTPSFCSGHHGEMDLLACSSHTGIK